MNLKCFSCLICLCIVCLNCSAMDDNKCSITLDGWLTGQTDLVNKLGNLCVKFEKSDEKLVFSFDFANYDNACGIYKDFIKHHTPPHKTAKPKNLVPELPYYDIPDQTNNGNNPAVPTNFTSDATEKTLEEQLKSLISK